MAEKISDVLKASLPEGTVRVRPHPGPIPFGTNGWELSWQGPNDGKLVVEAMIVPMGDDLTEPVRAATARILEKIHGRADV